MVENSYIEKDNYFYFWRIVIKAFVVINSYIWGYNQNLIGIITVNI